MLYTYEDFRCLHLLHTDEDNWDCTHYRLELVHYLNWKLLKLVARASKRRRGSSGGRRRGRGQAVGQQLQSAQHALQLLQARAAGAAEEAATLTVR